MLAKRLQSTDDGSNGECEGGGHDSILRGETVGAAHAAPSPGTNTCLLPGEMYSKKKNSRRERKDR